MAKSIAALATSLSKEIKAVETKAHGAETQRKALLKKIAGHEEPLIRMTNLEKSYLESIKKSNGIVSAKPSTIKALKMAEKDASKSTIAAAIAAISKEVKDAERENKADKSFKKYSEAADKVIDMLESIKLPK